MAKLRLMDRPEDYKRLGVNPNKIELWEDGRRNLNTEANNWEWWYSDFIFDDSSTAVVQFLTKEGRDIGRKGDHPTIHIRIKLADGTELSDSPMFKVSETNYSQKQCDVTMGENIFRGDLQEYHIRAISKKGFGVDLTLSSQSKPYRPGTAYFEFGNPENFYTWLCVVPRGEVSGTMTYNGQTHSVHGSGYHDHQWGSTNFLKEWNHWVWARQRFGDYSMLVFDLVASEKNDYFRFPITFIQDKDGNVVFENTKDVRCDVLKSYHDGVHSDKDYPEDIRYVFENHGKKAVYQPTGKQVLETGGLKTAPFIMKLVCKKMGINHSYARYLANGTLTLTDGNTEVKRSAELIYEFMFPGDSYIGHM